MSNLRCLVLSVSFALAPLGSAMGQQNDYGGYDIVSSPHGESDYAETRGWRVFAGRVGGRFGYCFAESVRSDGSAVRLGWDGQQWQLAVPIASRPDWEGTLQIDGAGSGQGYRRGGDFISGTAAGGWTIAWLGEAELDGLRQGAIAVLGVGRADYDFRLSGSTAAILKVKECVGRSGAGAGQAAAPAASRSPSPEDAMPEEATPVGFGKAGSWVINEIRAGDRVLACEVYDTTKPGLRFEIDSENSYIDFKDGGEMGDLGERKPIRILFDPGDEPSQSEVEIVEGRDGEKWARITEGRMDGPGLLDDAVPNSGQTSFIGQNIILETGLEGSNRALDVFFECSNGIR
ncbi:hypothetical protein [Jiella avicenniae]|uniref:Uncharacterized protein n=1 Tax=Jiella avicenniae TaxID=2907202 RepID=A0A9X1P2G7_9HYPH|nr:hypothetical protein [Jiella avicenniae]MCE7028128.1 hypothetical protein [Jiella avicenniae]